MKPLSPKDASILAVIAENAGIRLERIMRLVEIADDVEEVGAVARQLVGETPANGTTPSPQAKASAEGLRSWVQENRVLSHGK